MPHDFIITTEPGEYHDFTLTWSYDRTLIYMRRQGGTSSLSPTMAHELMRALMALLQGDFDRALSEVALRMEEEELRRRNQRMAAPSQSDTPNAPPPALDQL